MGSRGRVTGRLIGSEQAPRIPVVSVLGRCDFCRPAVLVHHAPRVLTRAAALPGNEKAPATTTGALSLGNQCSDIGLTIISCSGIAASKTKAPAEVVGASLRNSMHRQSAVLRPRGLLVIVAVLAAVLAIAATWVGLR